MYIKFKISVITILLTFLSTYLLAGENKILFKVNNKIVTTYDIYEETKYLSFLNKELKNFDKRKIYEISKNSIIKDIIKENELEKFYKEIKLDEVFLEKFLIDYFKKFNLNTIKDLKKKLSKSDLKFEYVVKKITIQLLWNELIFNKFSKKVKINKNLIKDELSKKKIQNEFLISEIVFNVNKKNELDTKYKIIQNEIKNKNFSSAAIIHSTSETSVNGGSIGWIKENSLSTNIRNALRNINVGEITNPIKIPGGFIILKIEDKREIILDLNTNKEIEIIVKNKTNEQLKQFSNIYLNKIKKDQSISEL
tara:strand:- start:1594 stop:2520 length:927 start_codon:yes stop_codon:yes gene_type:complete